MTYRIIWKTKAAKQLRKFPVADGQNIYRSVNQLEEVENWKNVKQLKNHKYGYRMRVGRYRVLFNCENEVRIIKIEEVKKRDERTY